MAWFGDFLDYLHEKEVLKSRPVYLKTRLAVSVIMILFSILGVFITQFFPQFAFRYWRWMVPLFAILCIGLSILVAKEHRVSGVTIWHEVLHWLALLATVYLVSIIVNTGVISFIQAALFVLILLALTIFLAGVHFDAMFIPIGILLGLLALMSVLVLKYLVVILIPIAILIVILLIWRVTQAPKAGMEGR